MNEEQDMGRVRVSKDSAINFLEAMIKELKATEEPSDGDKAWMLDLISKLIARQDRVVQAAVELRHAQRTYFMKRTTETLVKSKTLETAFDRLVVDQGLR